MHRIHHEYEKHTNNYGDIVWWDMLLAHTKIQKSLTAPVDLTPKKSLG